MKKILVLLLVFCMGITIIEPLYASDITSFMEKITLEKDENNITKVDTSKWESEGSEKSGHDLFIKYKNIALVITTLLTMTSFFSLFYFISKLSTSLDNEFSRKKTYMGIVTSAVGVILMGGSSAILAFFYQFFQP